MKRQVFFNSDGRGITLLSVAFYSLLKTAVSDEELTVFVAGGLGFREAGGEMRLRRIAAHFPFARLVFIDFNPLLRMHADLFKSEKWTPLLWAFPLCTELLPADIHGNLVYLDIDMLIRKDLAELYSMPLRQEGFLAAAVNESRRETRPHLIASGWPENAGYGFSNATLVIDADAYREERIPERIIAWYATNKETSLAVDQDAQNVVFGAKTKRLPLKWNYSDGWLERLLKFPPWQKEWRVHRREDVLEAILDPCIIHYVGHRKPTGVTHRPERAAFHQALRELGLYEDCFPTPPPLGQHLTEAFFNGYHAVLKHYARYLKRWYI